MGVGKSLWASVQGDPVFMRKLNGWLTIQWLVHFPIIIGLYFAFPSAWQTMSILYLALVSIYANVAGHLSAWQAARVEVAQQIDMQKREQEDIAADVAAHLIKHTSVEKTPPE